jgi:hypothetical protein
MSILAILDKLASNNSRNFKIETLTAYKNDELLKTVIQLALDPFTNFYQRKIPAYTPAQSNQADTLSSVIPSLAMLSTRQVTGHAAIEYLTKLLSNLTADDAQVLERIVLKDLKCGFAASTTNSVWPGMISEYPVMLCSQFDQKLVGKFKWPAAVQLKMDGMRFNAIVRDGKCEFRSRNGKEVNLLGCLEQEFIHIADGKSVVFDGELLVESASGVADRQTGNGILNKAVKGTISVKEAALVRATVWDMIPYDKFISGSDSTPYLVRYGRLESLALPAKIRLVEHTIVQDYEEAEIIFKRYLDQGQEGIILKDLNGPWEDKRAKHQIKFKGELECDLKIVGLQEGTGKYAGMLGAVLCESADGIVKTSVGSGFSDDQRKTLGPEIIGKVMAIKYNMRIRNKQGEESLFLPIVLEIREDKTVADSSQDIK